MSKTVDDNFLEKMVEVYNSLNVDPTDALLVMYIESGLQPSAVNVHGGARGLVQFMPFTLRALKADEDTIKNFPNLSGEEQLHWIEKLVKSQLQMTRLNSFQNAVQYYQANFMPATVRSQFDPNQVIAEKGSSAYDYNKGLDYDKDGKITPGDLAQFLLSRAKSSGFQNWVVRLNKFGGKPYDQLINELTQIANFGTFAPVPSVEKKTKSIEDSSDSIENLAEMFDEAIKDIRLTASPNKKRNSFYINADSNNSVNSVEYLRIFSCFLEENFKANTTIYKKENDFQLECKFDFEMSNLEFEKLLNHSIDLFKSATSENINANLSNNINGKPLTYKEASYYYRQFLLNNLRKKNG